MTYFLMADSIFEQFDELYSRRHGGEGDVSGTDVAAEVCDK